MTEETLKLAKKLDALGLWESLAQHNWALKPLGTVMPYFCTAISENGVVKTRLLFIEGWRTFQNYVANRADRWFGYISSPMELAHFELIVMKDGQMLLARYDEGFAPRETTPEDEAFLRRLMWQAYGVMMRLESDSGLILRYAGENALFARIETKAGEWTDSPLAIPPFRPIVEKIGIEKKTAARVKDLPIVQSSVVAVDVRIVPGLFTRDKRPKTCYAFVVIDAKTGRLLACRIMTVQDIQSGVKALWESVSQRLLEVFAATGVVPGEIQVVSGRLFRYLRPLGMTIPVKLSLHDKIDGLDEAFQVENLRK